MCKLTMKTPYAEMHRVFWHEREKCFYWAGKKFLGDQKVKKCFETLTAKRLEASGELKRNYMSNEKVDIPMIEYNAPSGNKWLISYEYTLNKGTKANATANAYLLWETVGSFGVFFGSEINHKKCILIYSGHYWQRYCERTGAKMDGINTAIEYFKTHKAAKASFVEYDGKKGIENHVNNGCEYGVCVSEEFNVYEIRTFIPEDQMSVKKAKEHNNVELIPERLAYVVEKMNNYRSHHPNMSEYELLLMLSPEDRKYVLDEFIKYNKVSIHERLTLGL